MTRLKDIALQAGCSINTVSKALRGSPDISLETRKRINQLAQQMGYVPDALAQCMRSRSTRLFGVTISSPVNPMFARTLLALEELAHQDGRDLIIAHTLNNPEREEICIRRMLSRRVEGLFLSPVYRMAPTAVIYQELLQRRTPTVILGQRAPFCAEMVNVDTDDQDGSLLLTRHLLGLGHKQIAFFAGAMISPPALDRLEGYRRGLREAGITPDDHLLFHAGSTIEEGAAAARQMLSESTQVTAIEAVNDLVAIGAATVLIEKGIRIPQDVSITGFGNVLTSEHFRVPLTTVRQPKYRLGVAAMELMQKLMTGEKPASRRLQAELVLRASTGPAR